MDTATLLFIDETAVATNLIRTYGRSPKGQRLVDKTPPIKCKHGQWKIVTCIAAMDATGMRALGTFGGAMNGELFRAWVEQILVPTLKPGDIVIWDNLPTHKNQAARMAIEAAGASIKPLPSYSPDLNPIEKAFSKLKAKLRKAKPRTYRAVNHWIAKICKTFALQECMNYFRSCGYSN